MEIISPVSYSSYLEIIKIISKNVKSGSFLLLIESFIYSFFFGKETCNKTGRRKRRMS